MCHIFKLPVPNFVSFTIGFLVLFWIVSRSSCMLQMFNIAIFRHYNYLLQISFVNFIICNHILYLTLTCSQSLSIVSSIMLCLSNLPTSIHLLCLYVNLALYHLLLGYCTSYIFHYPIHTSLLYFA